MNALTVGELFAGYGGLGMGVSSVLDAEMTWYSEVDKGALKVLAHRFPGVPNVGDITTVDWSTVPRVDILTGGSPCQDLSHAGRRKGMTEGTRSNLWVAMREAIAQLRPGMVIWENVRGAYSAEADSALEHDARLLADTRRRDGEPVLRALGRVLGDLSDLGYMGGWHGLRAANIGAPHGRFRVFVVAYPAGDSRWQQYRDGALAGHAESVRRIGREAQLAGALDESAGDGAGSLLGTPRCADGVAHDLRDPADIGNPRGRLEDQIAMLPTPRVTDGTKGGPNQRGSSGDLMLPSAVQLLPTPQVQDERHGIANAANREASGRQMQLAHAIGALLPTPAVNDMGASYTPETWDAWCGEQQAKHGNGNGHGKSLSIEAQRLLPTPRASDGPDATSHARSWSGTDHNLHNVAREQEWGQYAAAIHRWEALTRPAPPPTETGPKGNPRLSAAFSEWLMGLPDGWITDVPGITRNEALRLVGNGVVPQQCAAAVRFLLGTTAATEVGA